LLAFCRIRGLTSAESQQQEKRPAEFDPPPIHVPIHKRTAQTTSCSPNRRLANSAGKNTRRSILSQGDDLWKAADGKSL
jgi:hypothetical protein